DLHLPLLLLGLCWIAVRIGAAQCERLSLWLDLNAGGVQQQLLEVALHLRREVGGGGHLGREAGLIQLAVMLAQPGARGDIWNGRLTVNWSAPVSTRSATIWFHASEVFSATTTTLASTDGWFAGKRTEIGTTRRPAGA